MTVTESRRTEAWSAEGRERQRGRPSEPCAQCRAPLAEDQEWCLECGSSRTLIYASPDWRVPVAVVVVVILIAVAGFAFAVTRLSDNSAAPVTGASASVGNVSRLQTAAASAASATASSASQAAASNAAGADAKVGSIADWPVGLSGWTVVLSKYSTKTEAEARAQAIAPTGTPVGVFNSNLHPLMKPGFWVVFSNRFPNRYDARVSAAHLIAEGYTTAVARQVARPGGL
jgi:hypothetical protein